ncbi:MAG: hypothetical protein Ct9H300mP4_09420 [Gammaproteobacteria bacterium]|nr:MAG: hypothetical protein Ct9H300mP4_09420 [Gammaproteobacteria bacterium]
MVHGNATEGKDYDLDELTWLWDVTTKADERIVINNQKGINSRKYQPGPFTKKRVFREKIYKMVSSIDASLKGASAATSAQNAKKI